MWWRRIAIALLGVLGAVLAAVGIYGRGKRVGAEAQKRATDAEAGRRAIAVHAKEPERIRREQARAAQLEAEHDAIDAETRTLLAGQPSEEEAARLLREAREED